MVTFASSNFARDWYGHITNQGAHGGVLGLGVASFVAPSPECAVAWWASCVLAYWIIVELALQPESRPFGGKFFDGLEDTAHFAFGLSVALSLFLGQAGLARALFAGWALVLGFGSYLRFKNVE